MNKQSKLYDQSSTVVVIEKQLSLVVIYESCLLRILIVLNIRWHTDSILDDPEKLDHVLPFFENRYDENETNQFNDK